MSIPDESSNNYDSISNKENKKYIGILKKDIKKLSYEESIS